MSIFLAAPLALAGCTKDVSDAFPIEVSVRGNPAPITVTLEWGVTRSEALELGPDATAEFETQLPPGTAATVRGPSDCRFTSLDTAIALTTKDEPGEISLGCPGVLELANLAPSTPVLQTQENLSYQLTLAALRVNPSPDVMISPIPKYESSTVQINNGSAPQKLRMGTNSVDVAAPTYGLSRSYSVTLTTTGTAREHSKVLGPDAAGQLGAAIAADGDTVAIAQPGLAEGRVLVFRLGPTGWALEATLIPAADAGAGSGFGTAVAMLGDTIAVGAPLADLDGSRDVGVVYMYGRSGASWSLLRSLTTLAPNRFGSAVALGPGGMLAVGAPQEINSRGAVYVYAKQGDIPENQRVRLVASNFDDNDRFGHAVAFAGEKRLLVAAPGEDGANVTTPTVGDNAVVDSGAVYGFSFDTSWTRDRYYKSTPMPVVGGGFGQTLAASGDWVASAWRSATAGAVECANTVNQTLRYSISIGAPISSLSMDRGRISFTHPGSMGPEIRTFRLEASGAVQMAPAISSPGATIDLPASNDFGRAQVLAGERLFVGAPRQAADAGAFYTFE